MQGAAQGAADANAVLHDQLESDRAGDTQLYLSLATYCSPEIKTGKAPSLPDGATVQGP